MGKNQFPDCSIWKIFYLEQLFFPFFHTKRQEKLKKKSVTIIVKVNLKNITNSWPQYPRKITLEQIFLTVGQNNYDNKIPFLLKYIILSVIISKNFQEAESRDSTKNSRFQSTW